MPRYKTQILSKHQKEQLKQLLDLADNKEEAFTLTELEGFLFGLAITPDVIMTSEWLPEIFGGEMPTFDTKKQEDLLISNLMEAYNSYIKASHAGTLRFPFDMKKLSGSMIDDIQDWSYGLLEALKLRPEVWYFDNNKDYEELAEDAKDIVLSYCIVIGMVYPEEGQDFFKKHGKPIKDEAESMAIFLRTLPSAVATLQSHGARMEENRQHNMNRGVIDMNRGGVKIGRNDPCPCGSGKKYKKCCGMN